MSSGTAPRRCVTWVTNSRSKYGWQRTCSAVSVTIARARPPAASGGLERTVRASLSRWHPAQRVREGEVTFLETRPAACGRSPGTRAPCGAGRAVPYSTRSREPLIRATRRVRAGAKNQKAHPLPPLPARYAVSVKPIQEAELFEAALSIGYSFMTRSSPRCRKTRWARRRYATGWHYGMHTCRRGTRCWGEGFCRQDKRDAKSRHEYQKAAQPGGDEAAMAHSPRCKRDQAAPGKYQGNCRIGSELPHHIGKSVHRASRNGETFQPAPPSHVQLRGSTNGSREAQI